VCILINFVTYQESAGSDPNSHSYMQSSVMTYSNTGQGPPKVYQATTATRQAPGGVSCALCYFPVSQWSSSSWLCRRNVICSILPVSITSSFI